MPREIVEHPVAGLLVWELEDPGLDRSFLSLTCVEKRLFVLKGSPRSVDSLEEESLCMLVEVLMEPSSGPQGIPGQS